MRPRTVLQCLVDKLKNSLPHLTDTQEMWAKSHCFEPKAFRTKRHGATCLQCGFTFQTQENKAVCPSCGLRLSIEDSLKINHKEIEYFCMPCIREDFQVLRYFVIHKICRKGNADIYTMREVVQQWIRPNGDCLIVARAMGMNYYAFDNWCWTSPLEIRATRKKYPSDLDKYNIRPTAVFPQKRAYTPIISRNGFKGKLHGCTPLSLICGLLTNPKAETLLKAKQYALLSFYNNGTYRAPDWGTIKVCMRNNYTIKDASMWVDYIALLRYFNLDILNAKYVCPKNIKGEHDKLLAKKNIIIEYQRREVIANKKAQELMDKENSEALFRRQKAKYFGLVFNDRDLSIVTLESVEAFYEEGKSLGHCVFSSAYYLREKALILSARVADKPIATIELRLPSLEVVQCRGKRNSLPAEKERIMKLLNDNIHLIKQRQLRRPRNNSQIITA